MTLYRYTKNIERMEVNLVIDFKDFFRQIIMRRFASVCEISPMRANRIQQIIMWLFHLSWNWFVDYIPLFILFYSYNKIVILYEFVSIYTLTKKIVIENHTFLIDLQIKYWFFFRFIIFLTRHRGLNKHLSITQRSFSSFSLAYKMLFLSTL